MVVLANEGADATASILLDASSLLFSIPAAQDFDFVWRYRSSTSMTIVNQANRDRRIIGLW